MTIVHPDLPYAYDALEPHVSEATLRVHHGKHHAGYVEKANLLSDGGPLDGADLETLVLGAEGALLNNAAQAWNHAFYFAGMGPDTTDRPDGEVMAAMAKSFGDFESFKRLFFDVAKAHFGSGWAWLVRENDGRLSIVATQNAGCPLRDGKTPLLVCDLWEHAYYLDRQNDRAAYLDAFWELVDWSKVETRFRSARTAKQSHSQPRTHGISPRPATHLNLLTRGVLSAALFLGSTLMIACTEGDAEHVGHEIDDAVEDVADAAEDVADETEDAVEDAADEIENP